MNKRQSQKRKESFKKEEKKQESQSNNSLDSEKRDGIKNRTSAASNENQNENENNSNDSQSDEQQCEAERVEEKPEYGGQKADLPNATINMVKGFIGIGILTLPSGFAKSGWLGGLLFFSICGSMILYLSQQMMDVANRYNSKARSITEFCVETLGKEKEIFVNIFLFGIQFGICVAYVIFFTTYFQESLCFFTDYNLSNSLCGSRFPSLLISLLLVTPSIFVRHMSKLKTWSMFANSLIVISLAVILISCSIKMDVSYITSDKVSAIQGMGFGNAIGLFVFAFEGTTLYFEIRNSMKEPFEFKQVLNFSLGGGIIVYGLIGLFGYLAFGSSVRDIILFNFPMTNPLYVFIQIFYCIAILLSYPLQMFPLVNLMDIKLLQKIKDEYQYQQIEDQKESRNSNQIQQDQEEQNIPQDNYSEDNPELELQNLSEDAKKQFQKYSIIMRVAALFLVFFIAIVFKKLTIFLNLIGSVGGCFFCFILPVVVYEKGMPEASFQRIYFNRGLLVVGVLLSLIGTISSLIAIYKSF